MAQGRKRNFFINHSFIETFHEMLQQKVDDCFGTVWYRCETKSCRLFFSRLAMKNIQEINCPPTSI